MLRLRELEPIGIDRPSSARMYDYFLGGSHHFEVDDPGLVGVLGWRPEPPDDPVDGEFSPFARAGVATKR
jgi:hypothetical protein